MLNSVSNLTQDRNLSGLSSTLYGMIQWWNRSMREMHLFLNMCAFVFYNNSLGQSCKSPYIKMFNFSLFTVTCKQVINWEFPPGYVQYDFAWSPLFCSKSNSITVSEHTWTKGCKVRIFSDTNPCNSSPCTYGTCTQLEDGFRCDCFDGYTGRLCESGKFSIRLIVSIYNAN